MNQKIKLGTVIAKDKSGTEWACKLYCPIMSHCPDIYVEIKKYNGNSDMLFDDKIFMTNVLQSLLAKYAGMDKDSGNPHDELQAIIRYDRFGRAELGMQGDDYIVMEGNFSALLSYFGWIDADYGEKILEFQKKLNSVNNFQWLQSGDPREADAERKRRDAIIAVGRMVEREIANTCKKSCEKLDQVLSEQKANPSS